MKRNKILKYLLIYTLLFTLGPIALNQCSMLKKAPKFTNPIKPATSADPWIVYKDGYYYYCHSNGNNKIYVTKTKNLQDIDREVAVNVWTSPYGKEYSAELWAPELHFIQGKWYIYFAADDGRNENHRMYCLESTSEDPQGGYEFKGKVAAKTDKWAIDGTVLDMDGQLYFLWSGWEGDENIRQGIYIAEMSNPYTISGERVLLSMPEQPWEMNGQPYINEGPQVLKKNDTIHIVYSASGSWTDEYCLGLLTCKDGKVMNPSSWEKTGPVFSKGETAYGPGHCSFVKSPDRKEDWIVYHACEFSGGGWAGRSVRAQKFSWKGDYPEFGTPVKVGEEMAAPSGSKE